MGNMPRRYFDLTDNMPIRGRWLLGTPKDLQGREVEDPWSFTDGTSISVPGPLKLPIDVPGTALDFSHASFSAPVVSARVAAVFAELAPAEVQTIPVEVDDQSEPFFILVATRLIRCIDDAACAEVERWTPEDGRPEKVGQYRDVYKMRIDPSKVGEAKVFRTWGWSIALIVREDIKEALERLGATGTKFEEV